jgi:octaprenyl-diphosphate synthase
MRFMSVIIEENKLSYATVLSPLKSRLCEVDDLIFKLLAQQDSLIEEVGRYVLEARGKRLRPALVFLTAACFNNQEHDSVVQRLAAIVELLHAATLLHDDVIDASLLRRGRSTVHEVWDNRTSILVGDCLYSLAFQLMAGLDDPHVVRLFAEATGQIITGEIQQNKHCGSLALSQADYFSVIGKKTAMLFAVAAQLPAVVHGATQAQIQNFYDFAYFFGMVYQLTDDYLDYFGTQVSIGKCLGDDFRQGKPTLPLLFAYQHSDAAVQQQLQQWFIDQKQDIDFTQVLALIHSTSALAKVKQCIDQYGRQAQQALACLAPSFADDRLRSLADFLAVCVQQTASVSESGA